MPEQDRFADDPKQRRPDVSLARAHLDWEPRVKLVGGVKKTIEYFDALLSERDVAVAARMPVHGASHAGNGYARPVAESSV